MSDIQEVEVAIEEAKKAVDIADKMTKFMKSELFKELIEEGFFKEYASRLVLTKADPGMAKESDQARIMKSLDCIGEFRQYLWSVLMIGNQARVALKEDEETYEELLTEEVS